MTNSGFRPVPSREITDRWEEMGGYWQTLKPNGELLRLRGVWSYQGDWIVRPIHPAHNWNHYPWMWQTLTGEDMTPTGEGWHWWRLDDSHPWSIGVVLHIDSFGLMLASRVGGLYEVSRCRFGGPVYGMPGEVGG